MNDIMKIVQPLEESNILLEGSLKQLKMKKRTKRRFLSILLGTLGATLLGNQLVGKGIVRTSSENKKGKGIVKASCGKE